MKRRALILFFFYFSAVVLAQDRGEDFFDKNYAGSPFENRSAAESDGEELEPSQKVKAKSEVSNQPPPKNFKEFVEDEPIDPMASAPTFAEDEEQSKSKVYKIGAVLNGYDQDLLIKKLDELLKVTEQLHVTADPVVIVGPPFINSFVSMTVLSKDWDAFQYFRMENVKAVMKLPEEFKEITSSPTWIFQTAQGRVLAEAPKNLAPLLTKDGFLVKTLLEE